jgi:hypothetical protein
MATLTGHVSTTPRRWQPSVQPAVKGVHAIAEETEVRCLGETSDEEIARRALSIPKWYAMVPQDAVQVTVQKGQVTLTGDEIWQYQQNAPRMPFESSPGHRRSKQHLDQVDGRSVRYQEEERMH